MSVVPREQLDRRGDNNDLRNRALLQIAVTEACTLLNAGKGQEAVGQIAQFADFAAQSSAGCYAFGLIHFNAGKLHDALSWFNRAIALQPAFPMRCSPGPAFKSGYAVLQKLGRH